MARAERSPLIMLVEDNQQLLKILTSALESVGLRILPATNAEDALGSLETHAPDVLVTDFGMAGMNGLELALHVQAHRPSLPVVITSGHPLELINVPPSVQFLAKPFSMAELIVTVRQALHSRGKAA